MFKRLVVTIFSGLLSTPMRVGILYGRGVVEIMVPFGGSLTIRGSLDHVIDNLPS